MWLDDFTPSESPESGWNSAEVSEKIKEWIKKWIAWIKRVKKDEQKAKKYDNMLASFLVEIIRDEKYDVLLPFLFDALNNWFNSNILIWILSLININISNKIREISKKELISFNYIKTFDKISFDDEKLDLELKNRINYWIEDIIDIVIIEYSSIQLEKLKEIKNKKEIYNYIILFTKEVFIFFFKEQNIIISNSKALSYTEFILEQVFIKIQEIDLEKV